MTTLRFTGERPVPGITPDTVFWPAVARYLFAADLLKPWRPARVLDVGCGTGIGSGFLAAAGHRVTGVEVDEAVVEWGRSRRFADDLDLVAGRGERLAFPERSFDCVIAFESVEHMDAPVDFLREARRVLRPGGLFLCSVPHCLNDVLNETITETNRYHVQRFTAHSLRHFLSLELERRGEWCQAPRRVAYFHRLLSSWLFWEFVGRHPALEKMARTLQRLRAAPRRAPAVTATAQDDYGRWTIDALPPDDRLVPLSSIGRRVPETLVFLAAAKVQ